MSQLLDNLQRLFGGGDGRQRALAGTAAVLVILLVVAVVILLVMNGDPETDVEPEPTPEDDDQVEVVDEPEATPEPVAYEPPHDRPGPAADRIQLRQFDVDRAPRDLQAGRMDFYLFSLKSAAARELEGDPDINLLQAPANTVSLILNPAPGPEGELNPFSIPEVRQGMQFLLDREFIARDIYGGMAQPMITHASPGDFDFLTVFDLDRGSGISYDPDFGRQLISDALAEAGAELDDGVWRYQGSPLRVRLVGRVEDERRVIADLVRRELEEVGFEVIMNYQTFAAATQTVYATDPQAFEWHIYTEGWGRGAPQRYDFASITAMNAPWLGNMPGWQEVGFWQYEHEELDELGIQLFRGEISSQEERNELYRRMTQLGLDESVRIWLATVTSTFPAQHDLQGITVDPVAGPRGPWTLREVHRPGEEEVVVGHLWIYTERTTWNPVGGFGDVFSVDIWRALHDPPMWNNPFTGLPEPLRASFEVETAGPDASLVVPQDAVLWDAAADQWRPVGSGVEAVSKVTFDYSDYFSANWHHGQPISMADVAYAIAQGYELAYDEDKVRIETAIGITARPYLETFRGYRVLDANRLEVYVDYWHFEERLIASYASPSSLSMPWEVMAAMDRLVFEERRAAYSDTAAARQGVRWLNLAIESHANLVQRTLRGFHENGGYPEPYLQMGDELLVSPEQADERFQAALDWFGQFGHLVISNGPFTLHTYDPPAQFAELRAFRDEGYPYRPGDWYHGRAPGLTIARPEPASIIPGDAFELSVSIEGPGTLGLRYLMIDPATGQPITSGEADPASNGEFTVSLSPDNTRDLETGFYELHLFAFSDEVALVTERRVEVDVT